jgi:hypothetical protein
MREFLDRLHVGVRMYLEAHREELRPTDLGLASTVLVAAVDAVFRAALADDRVARA